MSEFEGVVTGDGNGAWHEVERPDGRRVNLRFVLPGERVRVRERENDPGFGDLVELLEPSPARREPPCPRFGPCGGCQLQHVETGRQLELRAERARAALRRAGAREAADELKLVAAPSSLGYRSRARFQASAGTEGLFHLGFHETGGRRTLDVPDCPLLAPELAAAWEALRPAIVATKPRGLTGLEVTALPGSSSVLVALNPRDGVPEPWPAIGERLLERGALTGVSVQPRRGDGRKASLGETAALGRTPRGRPVAAALGGFLQANLAAADLLLDELLRLAEARGARVLELHAGSGLLGHALADAGAAVRSFELDERCVEAARLLPAPAAGSFELRPGDASRAFEAHREDADLLVTDPPRSGLGELAAEIARGGPARHLGVWCSLAGLERDLPTLLEAYRVTAASLIDLFPQTRHAELLLRLDRQ